jgi:hypothetical protein
MIYSGQHGDEPAELVAKKVLHQGARFAHALPASPRDRML